MHIQQSSFISSNFLCIDSDKSSAPNFCGDWFEPLYSVEYAHAIWRWTNRMQRPKFEARALRCLRETTLRNVLPDDHEQNAFPLYSIQQEQESTPWSMSECVGVSVKVAANLLLWILKIKKKNFNNHTFIYKERSGFLLLLLCCRLLACNMLRFPLQTIMFDSKKKKHLDKWSKQEVLSPQLCIFFLAWSRSLKVLSCICQQKQHFFVWKRKAFKTASNVSSKHPYGLY